MQVLNWFLAQACTATTKIAIYIYHFTFVTIITIILTSGLLVEAIDLKHTDNHVSYQLLS